MLAGLITLPLRCASKVACSGQLTITTKTKAGKHKRTRTLKCVAISFRLKANAKKSLKARVSRACTSLLNAARSHRIAGRLTSRTSTGQRGTNKNVVLTP